MKRIRKLLGAVLLILSVVTMQLPAFGAEAASTTQTVSDYVVDSDGVLTKYNGSSSSVIIPSNVLTIGTDAFKDNSKITSVVIPNTVTAIEPYAFWNCSSLSMVSIGTGLSEIGDFVFANCKSLSSCNIPSNIKRIGIYAFEDDISLTDITIPIETMDIHKTAFDGCYKLVIHAIEGSYAWKYAQDFYIRQQEFPEYEDVPAYDTDTDDTDKDSNTSDDSNDSTITNPDKNGDGIVSGDESGAVVIENDEVLNDISSVHVVGNKAVMFMNGSSPTVYMGDPNAATDISDGTTDGTGQGTGFDENADMTTDGIPKYTIVDNEIVADQAYYLNQDLSYVTLPESIKEIGQFSYARSSLTSIVLPGGLETIGYGAFYHCDDLGYVTLPDSVLKIEPKAFEYTKYLSDFKNGEGEGDFLVSGSSLIAYRGSDENVVIPDGVRVIAAEVFEDNTSIKSVTFPESIITIGEEAFKGCTNLNSVSLDNTSLISVLDRAFYDTALSAASLPQTITNMGLNAFDSDCVISANPVSNVSLTHELSAERLSNEDFRKNAYTNDLTVVSESSGAEGVNVSGIDGALAQLEGANEAYYLKIEKLSSSEELDRAVYRAKAFLDEDLRTGNAAYYDLELTDKSGISITKLGHSALTVAIPFPDELSKSNMITVLTVDRNGQLEEITPDVVDVAGWTFVRFDTYHLSPFGIYQKATECSADMILSSENVFEANAAPPEAELSARDNFKNWVYTKRFRIVPALLLLVSGIVLILARKKRF